MFIKEVSKPYPFNLASMSHILPRKSHQNISFATFENNNPADISKI